MLHLALSLPAFSPSVYTAKTARIPFKQANLWLSNQSMALRRAYVSLRLYSSFLLRLLSRACPKQRNTTIPEHPYITIPQTHLAEPVNGQRSLFYPLPHYNVCTTEHNTMLSLNPQPQSTGKKAGTKCTIIMYTVHY